MALYVIHYGCYLESCHILVESNWDMEALINHAYELAVENTNGWVGMHGFCEEEMEDLGLEAGNEEDEATYNEIIAQQVEDAADYYVEVYNPEVHDGYLHNPGVPEYSLMD